MVTGAACGRSGRPPAGSDLRHRARESESHIDHSRIRCRCVWRHSTRSFQAPSGSPAAALMTLTIARLTRCGSRADKVRRALVCHECCQVGVDSLCRSTAFAIRVRRTIEKPRGLTTERVGNLLQPARSDAVRTLLVFLDLLERKADCVSERLLAHPEHLPTHPDATSHMLVGRPRLFFGRGFFRHSITH